MQILEFNNDCWKRLTTGIANGDYILVVGSEVIIEGSKNQSVTDSNSHYQTLRRQLADMDDSVHNQMLSTIQKAPASIETISSTLYSLLATKCIRLVLTTTYDEYVEIAMREIWGDQLRVLDLYGDRSLEFDLAQELDSSEFYDVPPTLYYVFGKADPNNANKRFAISENEYMEALVKWLNNDTAPKGVLNYIKHKNILAIGCKFEDWFFRFFWYALRKDTEKLGNGQVAITLNGDSLDSSDNKLSNYLRKQHIYTYPNAEAFMKELKGRLNDIVSSIQSRCQQGGIFLSYASEDSALTFVIFNKLVSEGYNVWLDTKKLQGGDAYEERIEAAISSCSIFMPILSSQIQEDIQTNKNERYYREEWNLAKQHKKKIFPVVLSDYDLKSNEHKKIEEMLAKVTVFDFSNRPISDMINELNLKQ